MHQILEACARKIGNTLAKIDTEVLILLTPSIGYLHMNNGHFNDFLGFFILMGPLTLAVVAAAVLINFEASQKRLEAKIAKARAEAGK